MKSVQCRKTKYALCCLLCRPLKSGERCYATLPTALEISYSASSVTPSNIKKDRKCWYNVTLWRVRVNTISMVKQQGIPFTNLSHIHCCCEKIKSPIYSKPQNPYKKFTLEQFMKAKRGIRSISTIFFLKLGARWRWVVNATPGRFTPGKETRYPLYRRLGGSQDRSERVQKMSGVPEFDSRNVQPVACH